MGKVNEFLRIKVAQNKLSAHGFADSIGVTEEEAQSLLENAKPQPAFSRRISIALKFTPDEEAEFQQLLEEDESGANAAGSSAPLARPKASRIPREASAETVKMINSLWVAVYFLGAGIIFLAVILFMTLAFLGEKL